MATKQIAWQTGSGNITLTYTGQGDGPVSVVSDANNVGARSQTITIQTTKGGLITKNVTVSQAACPIPVGTVLNYAYTGSYQEVELPAGQYKLQCWGAQGGSNATASSYGITAKAGGKGGYSEGVLTLTSKTTVRIYVGGQGSSSAGGFNGGGSTSGSSSYSSGDTYGTSRMGGGGGATDIRLSDGSLYSRMIVAGGGSGGAMGYEAVTTTSYNTVTDYTLNSSILDFYYNNSYFSWILGNDTSWVSGRSYTLHKNNTSYREISIHFHKQKDQQTASDSIIYTSSSSTYNFTAPSKSTYPYMSIRTESSTALTYFDVTITHQESSSSTTTSTDGHTGYAGGGERSEAVDTAWVATQTTAGINASFGQGANQTATNYRYCGGAGGGGWYGGSGNEYSDNYLNCTWISGGGSGWVNTSASAGNRPSGFSSLQLDSGSTYKGNTSFVAPGGGNETGHAGNGYARITRIS